MEKITSFTINHLKLMPGIYVSRVDVTPAGDALTTFDIRMTAPNRDMPLSPRVQHTIEHLAATFMRNHPVWAPRVVYWGPMGCCTGSYLIMQGRLHSADIAPLVTETFEFIASYQGEIPGATPRDCGQYDFMDPEGARCAARQYLDVLRNLTPDRLAYPD